MGQKTLVGIMAVVFLFFLADVAVFVLLYFNINLNSPAKTTDNVVFKNATDNSVNVVITATPLITPKATDNSIH